MCVAVKLENWTLARGGVQLRYSALLQNKDWAVGSIQYRHRYEAQYTAVWGVWGRGEVDTVSNISGGEKA